LLYHHVGEVYIIGITGAPGTGKSTLVDGMIEILRQDGMHVGVIAIDPSSPFSGGAILGDRIRMNRHSKDNCVFIRSLATRGHFGGLTRSTADVIRVIGALGKNVVIVERVGVGQDEIEIVNIAHTTVIVTIPGMGDEIQLMKAGIAEIGDLFVVNKADHEGADKTVLDLELLLNTRSRFRSEDDWDPLIFKTIATKNLGIRELIQGIYVHKQTQEKRQVGQKRLGERLESELKEIVKSYALKLAKERVRRNGGLKYILKEMIRDQIDP
jgi:LAO/AO transport system kinase